MTIKDVILEIENVENQLNSNVTYNHKYVKHKKYEQ